ncbi:DUF982 domain-containing protein [Bosea sp. OAE506]|uniref:DUF982 domain-containing protein n=1 Tax=Bosea sp. OAE506 TaxID=2663870 RepID=UPI001788FDED
MAPASDQFERPVTVFAVSGVPTAISSASEAYMYLSDCPIRHRDAAHEIAIKACLAVMQGDIEAETARGLVASWAERNGVLALDAAAFVSSTPVSGRRTP